MNAQSEAMKYFDALTENVDRLTQLFAEGLNEIGNRTETENIKNTAEDGGVKFDSRFDEYEKTISAEDVKNLHNLFNTRKSINDFSASEIEATQKWAYKFYKELGSKSPFFRAWFGDWRANDKSFVKIVDVPTISISDAVLNYGNYNIADTNWNVYAGKVLNDDTRHHSGGNRVNVKSLNAIKEILYNSLLFDTVVSNKDKNKKSNNTAFLHKLYTLVSYDQKPYIAKITVEEFYNETSKDVSKRAYNLKAIKIEPAGGQIGNNSSSSIPDTDSMISVSNLYALVKQYDKDFTPGKAVASELLNPDGTPKVLYHQTGNDFTVFDLNREGAGTYDDETPIGIFLKDSASDIGLRGKKQMALYASMKNPLVVNDRAELMKQLRQNVDFKDVNDLRIQTDKEYKEKFEKAKTEFVDFLTNWRKENPNAKRSDIYNDPEFEKVFEAEDNITSEWHEKINDISVEAKRIITDILKNEGYDGVIMKNDVGSFGRKTSAYIVFNENQVKSATDNIGTFSSDNNDIRYSDRDVELKKQYEKINRQLERENSQLREDVKNLRELNRLQGKVTGGKVFKGTSIQSVGRQTNLINRIVTAICVII